MSEPKDQRTEISQTTKSLQIAFEHAGLANKCTQYELLRAALYIAVYYAREMNWTRAQIADLVATLAKVK